MIGAGLRAMALRRRIAAVFGAAAAWTAAAAQSSAPQLAPGTPLDRVAAIAGGQVILLSDLNSAFALQRSQFPAALPDSEIRSQILQSMIDQKLLYAKALQDSVQVSDDEVDQQLDFRIQQFIQRYGSAKRVEDIYGKSIAQIKRDYRDELKRQMMGERWLEQKLGEAQRVTQEEVREFYTTYKDTLAHDTIPVQYDLSDIAIAVAPSAAARDSAYAFAERLLDSLHRGADFAALARRYSQDTASAIEGGDLGFQKRGIFVKPFEQAAFALKETQISGIVETQFGFHIIQLLERRGEEVHVRHILIRIARTEADTRAALDTLAHIRDAAMRGAAFSVLAFQRSADPDTKLMGGEMGLLSLDAMPPALRDLVQNMKPGEISAPAPAQITESASGYKIYRLNRTVPAHVPNLDQDYNQLQNLAAQYIRQQRINAIMQDVRNQVFWKIESSAAR